MKRKAIFYKITPGARLFLMGLCSLVGLGLMFLGHPAGVALATAGGIGFTEDQTKELTKLFNSAGEKHEETIKTVVKAQLAGIATKEEISAHLDKAGIKDGIIKSILDTIEKQGETLTKILSPSGTKTGAHKSVDEIVDDHAEKIKQISKANGAEANIKLLIPSAAKTLVTRAAVSGSTFAQRLNDVGQLPTPTTILRGLFRNAPMEAASMGVIRFWDQAAVTRNAAFVAEGAAKPESAISWIERLWSVGKVADSIPVTKEAWSDIPFIKEELRRFLELNLNLAEDKALFDGTGVSPQIVGILTYAPEWDEAAYAADVNAPKVENANLMDLIAILRAVIMNNKDAKYSPNTVIMNPFDVLRMRLLKGTDGHYMLPSSLSTDAKTIEGIRVYETSRVPMGQLIIGDFRYGTIYDLEDTEITFGWVNNQFLENKFTILGEKRMGLLVRNVDADAFLKVTSIADALEAIEAGA